MLFACYVFGDKYDFGADSLDFSTKLVFGSGRKRSIEYVSCQMKISENRYTAALTDGELF
jgi:hypothetical protein